MLKAKILGISIVATLLLTSVVMAETHTFEKATREIEITGCMNPPEVEWEKTYGDTGTDFIIFVSVDCCVGTTTRLLSLLLFTA